VRSLFAPWLQRGDHFVLVGPEGAGKNMLLQHAFRALLPGVAVATVHCTSGTTAAQVIAQLRLSCTTVNTAQGRVLRPKTGLHYMLTTFKRVSRGGPNSAVKELRSVGHESRTFPTHRHARTYTRLHSNKFPRDALPGSRKKDRKQEALVSISSLLARAVSCHLHCVSRRPPRSSPG